MKQHIHKLTKKIKENKTTWLMGVLNVIASVIIAGGGIDIAKNKTAISENKTEISESKQSHAVLHKRITEQQIEIAKLKEQVNSINAKLNNK